MTYIGQEITGHWSLFVKPELVLYGDRVRFFALLQHQIICAGLRNLETFYKEACNHGSIS